MPNPAAATDVPASWPTEPDPIAGLRLLVSVTGTARAVVADLDGDPAAATPERRRALDEDVRCSLEVFRQWPQLAAGLAAVQITRAATRDVTLAHSLTARYVLAETGKWDPNDDEARNRLAQATAHAAIELADVLDAGGLRELDDLEGMTATASGDAARWDAALADYLDTIGPTGQRVARSVRDRTREREADLDALVRQQGWWTAGQCPPVGLLWGEFVDFGGEFLDAGHACPALARLAHVLWWDRVRPDLEQDRSVRWAKAPAPAVVRSVQLELTALHKARRPDQQQTDDGGIKVLDRGMVVARFAAVAADRYELLRRGVRGLAGILAERLCRHLSRKAWEQAKAGVNPFQRLVYPGGLATLGDALDLRSNTHRANLPALLEALQAYRGGRRDVPSALSYWINAAAPGRRAELRIDVGEALCPGYAGAMRRRGKSGPELWLLPTLEIPALPPGENRRNLIQFCDLQWELLAEFRGRVKDLDDDGPGGWDVDPLVPVAADRGGLPAARAVAAVEFWIDAPEGWLRRTDGGAVVLRDADAMALFRDAQGHAKRTAKRWAGKARKRRSRNVSQ